MGCGVGGGGINGDGGAGCNDGGDDSGGDDKVAREPQGICIEYFPVKVPNSPIGGGGDGDGSGGGGGCVGGVGNGGGGGGGKNVGYKAGSWGWSIICSLCVFCLKKSCVRDRQTNGPTNPLVEIL